MYTALAKRLAEVGELVTFEAGKPIISQDAEDNDVYFILVGEADVLVNNRHVAVRKARDSVGEMALLNPTEPRSATITARSRVVALKIAEPDFHQIAGEHPQVWKVIAQVVSDRLRQRKPIPRPGDGLGGPRGAAGLLARSTDRVGAGELRSLRPVARAARHHGAETAQSRRVTKWLQQLQARAGSEGRLASPTGFEPVLPP